MDLLKEDPCIQIQSFTGGHLSRYNEFVTYLQKNNICAIFSYLTAANFYACMAGRKVKAKVFTGLRNAELPLLNVGQTDYSQIHLQKKLFPIAFPEKRIL